MFRLDPIPSQKGKIAIVTGANTGLGYETAKVLADKGCTVIMACRNEQKAEDAIKRIANAVPDADTHFIPLDLGVLQSVRDFAKAFRQRYEKLDLLINNAGIMIPPFGKTTDGFEQQMGVNYFGHFLLTNLLWPVLAATPYARVVTLSSKAHENAKIDFSNLNAEQSYSKFKAYGQSKLACLMFAIELQRRINLGDAKVASLSAHPGISNTELGRHFPKWAFVLMYPIFSLIIHAPHKAALPTLQAALDPEARGGEYYGPTGFNEMKGAPGKVQPKPHALDQQVAERLWQVSEELTGEGFAVQ